MENKNKISSLACHVCGDLGYEDLIMTCYSCREVREHTYCAKIGLRSAPDMWLCQVCRSSTRILQIVDNNMTNMTNDHCASKPEISSKFSKPSLRRGVSRLDQRFHGLMLLAHTVIEEAKRASNDASLSKKHQPQFLAFPSPKRKRRSTLRNPDTEEANCQGPQSSYPCVFHRID